VDWIAKFLRLGIVLKCYFISPSSHDRVKAAIGYIPFLCVLPFLGPQSAYIKIHQKIAFTLLINQIFFLSLAFIAEIKVFCFYLFAVMIALAMIGFILALAGFYIELKS